MANEDIKWDERYLDENAPWDTGKPSSELRRILGEHSISVERILELGCGTGTNAIYLAQQGHDVTAVDLSLLAIERARKKASVAGVDVRFHQGDLVELPEGEPPFPFVFDRGVYHHVRQYDLHGYLNTLSRVLAPGGMYLTLAGNANEIRQGEDGPPRVTATTICRELTPLMNLVQLREIRFDEAIVDGKRHRILAWSALFRR